jgi:two-component system, NarL family, nitrate/nitrite response regulator NarL
VSKTTPTVIVASSALLREGITSLLQDSTYEVLAAVGRPGELADHEFTGRVLAITGVGWQNGSDQIAESIRQLRSLMPTAKIVVVAETCGPVDLQRVVGLAPDGYILNLGSRDMLVRSLELIFMDQQIFVLGRTTAVLPNGGDDTQFPGNGGDDTQFPGRAVGSLAGNPCGLAKNGHQLSPRENQVLICLAHGESNKGIARVCHISEATVKVHLKAILRKTNARNRTQAAIWAVEHGLAAVDVAA